MATIAIKWFFGGGYLIYGAHVQYFIYKNTTHEHDEPHKCWYPPQKKHLIAIIAIYEAADAH